jgi:hypothetical protein
MNGTTSNLPSTQARAPPAATGMTDAVYANGRTTSQMAPARRRTREPSVSVRSSARPPDAEYPAMSDGIAAEAIDAPPAAVALPAVAAEGLVEVEITGDEDLDILAQGSLIALQRDNVIGLFLDEFK